MTNLKELFEEHKTYWKLNRNIKSLVKCKNCKHHVKIENRFTVICNRLLIRDTIVHIMPNHYNKGFFNNEYIVNCKRRRK